MLKHKSLIFLAALAWANFTTANLISCATPGETSTGINDKTSNDTVIEEDTVDDDSVVDDASVIKDTHITNTDTSDSDSDSAVEDTDPSPITWTECSGKPGEKACDFTFQDQNGNDWSLYDNYGTVMVVDFSTIWCGVCNSIAGDAQIHQDTYTALGYDFLWVTVLVDGPSWGTPPTPSEIQDWVSRYGMTTSPVLAGDRSIIDLTAEDGYPISAWPTIVVVDETLTVHNGLLGWNEEIVFGWVDDVFGIVR
jgi:hypothetical protein